MKYQTLKFLCAVGWGTVALVMSVIGMWALTELPIWDVIFRAVAIYFVVMTFIIFLANPKQAKAQPQAEEPRKFKMYDIKRRRWDAYEK